MDRRTFLAGTAALGASLIAGCSGGDSGDGGDGDDGGDGGQIPETTSVSMTDNQFDPRNIRVDVGATVTWTNDDSFGHTVSNASDNWSKDAEVSAGGETTHTFDSAGVYDVYCRFHGGSDLSGMSMKIGVGDATIENPLGSLESGDDGGVGGY